MRKNNSGVTLIALIITIIVLLILAGVTIAMIMGDNGILNQATNAKTQNTVGEEKEYIGLAYSAAFSEYYDDEIYPEDIQYELENMIGENKTECLESDGNILVKFLETGNRYILEPNGNIIDEGPLVYTQLASQIDSNNYGDFIDYGIDLNDDGDTTNDWKIFYAENGNTFIIAADYLLVDKVPEEASIRKVDTPGYDYSVRWLSIPPNNGANDIDSEVANKFKFTWLEYDVSNNDQNLCVSSILLNTSIWSEFASEIEGAEAIGTPTLEMFIASWNQKYNDSKLYYTVIEGENYLVGNTENPTESSTDVDSHNDTLYFPHLGSYNNCWGYWLVAPWRSNYLMDVQVGYVGANTGYNNDVEPSAYYEGLWTGIRPVVCLPETTNGANDYGVWVLEK